MTVTTASAGANVAVPRAQRVRIALFNPSPYGRNGAVTAPWQPIARVLGDRESVRVYREIAMAHSPDREAQIRREAVELNRRELATQIDRVDPEDRSRDQLVIRLDDPLDQGDEDYTAPVAWGVVEPETPASTERADVYVEALPHGVKLVNDRLDIYISTSAWHDGRGPYFGGAATSVQLYRMEMLDALADVSRLPHHPAKRGMQLDRIRLVRPPWNEDGSIEVKLYDKPWRCVYTNIGPIRGTVTIMSEPFPYECKDVDGNPRAFTCAVYRAISIYPRSEQIVEDAWVKAISDRSGTPVSLWFRPRYFMMMQLTTKASAFRYPNHPGWFVLTSPTHPYHGYGFATDAQAGPIWNPPLDYDDPDTEHRAYCWESGAVRSARAVHLFRLGTNRQDLSDAIGWSWYDLAFKALRARLV